MHPSFGPVPEKAFREAQAAPAGKATDIIRKYVPTFGIEKSEGPAKTFTVKCSQYINQRQTSTVDVDAASEDEAKRIVMAMDDDDFDWDNDSYNSGADNFQIDDVEENS